jgi:hypothetical protein
MPFSSLPWDRAADFAGCCFPHKRESAAMTPVMNQNGSVIRTMMKVFVPILSITIVAKPAR